MNARDDGGAAFPQIDTATVGSQGEYQDRVYSYGGMTLRDYFAAKAMPAFLQNALDNEITFDGFDSFDGMIAEQAYALADAMLAARSGT